MRSTILTNENKKKRKQEEMKTRRNKNKKKREWEEIKTRKNENKKNWKQKEIKNREGSTKKKTGVFSRLLYFLKRVSKITTNTPELFKVSKIRGTRTSVV